MSTIFRGKYVVLYFGGEAPIEDDIRPNVKPMHMEPAPRGAIWVIPPNFIPGVGSVVVRFFCKIEYR